MERTDIIALQNELTEMSEYLLVQKIRHFDNSISIFKGNYFEIMQYLVYHNDPKQSSKMFSTFITIN